MLKTSVLVIAHNEEKYIQKCLESLFVQTKIPDEILVVAHNCNDKTVEIVQRFPHVRIVVFNGPPGIIYARIKGFEEVKNEIIACIDGDSCAENKWLEGVTQPLEDSKVSGVGTVVHCYGSMFGFVGTFKTFYFKPLLSPILGYMGKFYFFGPSFALRKSDYLKVGGFEPFINLKKELKLINWPDDCYLSLTLWKLGKVVLVRSKHTRVCAVRKDRGLYGKFVRPFEQTIDAYKLYAYFRNKC